MWINDGFMVVFFVFVGFEVKWEMFEGLFLSVCKVFFFVFVVFGGMIVLVLIYYFINYYDFEFVCGWVILMVMDIVFVLGIVVLFSK